MIEKKVILGFDRFMALAWADYSLDLFLSSGSESANYQALKIYLASEISGSVTSRKTGNQLKRLWLTSSDRNQDLRDLAKTILVNHPATQQSIFHIGMAINVFPVFRETCNQLGVLSRIQGAVPLPIVSSRVAEAYASPKSMQRVVARIIQTLIDWQLLSKDDGSLKLHQMTLKNNEVQSWFVLALLKARNVNSILITDLEYLPEKLGVSFGNIRSAASSSPQIQLGRSSSGLELISILPPAE
jgi:hypothetical protein